MLHKVSKGTDSKGGGLGRVYESGYKGGAEKNGGERGAACAETGLNAADRPDYGQRAGRGLQCNWRS